MGVPDPDELLALPFDQYQRYKLIQEVVARLDPRGEPAILDVGGWPGTLQRFLPEARVVIADMQGHLPNMVRADGAALPFADNRFDLVVSSDTFEHIAPARRARFVGELLRVSRDAIVLGAPFDRPEVRAAEAVFREAVREKYPASYGFIEEHAEYGLPDLDETLGLLRDAGCATVALPNGYLRHWLPMLTLYFMLQWRSPYEPLFARLNAFYNATYYREDNRAPSYRTTIVACRFGAARLASLPNELCAAGERDEEVPDSLERWPQLAAILKAIELEVLTAPRESMRRVHELERLVGERTAWAEASARQVAARDETIRQLQAALAEQSAWAQASARQVAARDETIARLQMQVTERDETIMQLQAGPLGMGHRALGMLAKGLKNKDRQSGDE